MTDKTTYGWSVDEELFFGEYASREEALAAALKENPEKTTVWTARSEKPNIRDLVSYMGSRFIEQAGERAYEIGGHAAEGWLTGVGPEEEKALDAALVEAFVTWAKNRGFTPDWWTAADVIQHHVIQRHV